jgi:hypothetical protein
MLRRSAIVALALLLLAPGCRRRRAADEPVKAKARRDAGQDARPAAAAPIAAKPPEPDAAPPKTAEWCSRTAEKNASLGEGSPPGDVASPGEVVKSTGPSKLARNRCCRRAARWRAKLSSDRVEFVLLEDRRSGDGIYALVLRRIPTGHCVLGAYAKHHGGVGTSFERITDAEVGPEGKLARIIFRFTGENRSFTNDDGTTEPGDVTRYNVMLITDGARVWSATWTDRDLADLRKAVLLARRLVGQGKHSEALELYDKAHAIQPLSPQIAAERGLVALRAGNLEKARASSARALRLAFGGFLRGKILANLGRISEQGGDLKQAEDYYHRSYKLRANREVKKRLQAVVRRRAKEKQGED